MPGNAYYDIDKLLEGAVSKRFGEEWNKLLDNIYDMRTSAIKPRTVTLKITVTPNAVRDASNIKYDVSSKLQPPEALQQIAAMRQRDDGSVQMQGFTDQVPGQLDMSGNETPVPTVVAFRNPTAVAQQE